MGMSMDEQADGKTSRLMLSLAAFVVVVAGMKAAADILVPVLMSLFITVICAPPLFWMKQRKIPTALALVALLLVLVVAGMALVGVVNSSVSQFSQQLPLYQERVQGLLAQLSQLAGRWDLDISQDTLGSYFSARNISRLFAQILGGLTQVLTDSLFVILTVIFMLLESFSAPDKIARAMGQSQQAMAGLQEVVGRIQKYMGLKALMSLLTGVAVGIWLYILGVDYAVMWALLAFLFNFVPNIGSIIAAIPAVLLALLQLGPAAAAWTALGFLVVNGAVGNVLEPRIMGRGVGLSTLVVFLSLVFWGWVLGMVGMVLSVPLTIAVRIALDSSPQTKWLAVLLGPQEGD